MPRLREGKKHGTGTDGKGTKGTASSASSQEKSSDVTHHAENNSKRRLGLTWKFLLSYSVVACLTALVLLRRSSSVESNEKPSEAFEVVDLPGKGKGVVALRDIKQGELLIHEKPLFLLPSSTHENPSTIINRSLAILTDADRQAFFSLSFMPPDVSRHDAIALATFQTNAIAAGNSVGIFPTTARLNHGCSAAFNAVYSWRENEGALTVHALKSIHRGAEILTTYTDTKRSRSERREFLQAHYHFECGCATCSLPGALSRDSDNRLTEMSSLYQKFRQWGDGALEGLEASRIAKRIWMLGEQEGYWSERGSLAADVIHIAAAHSDLDAVLAWGKLAILWYSYELGDDCDRVASLQLTMADPQSHPAWSTRARLAIERPD